jgi:hypothetical protein
MSTAVLNSETLTLATYVSRGSDAKAKAIFKRISTKTTTQTNTFSTPSTQITDKGSVTLTFERNRTPSGGAASGFTAIGSAVVTGRLETVTTYNGTQIDPPDGDTVIEERFVLEGSLTKIETGLDLATEEWRAAYGSMGDMPTGHSIQSQEFDVTVTEV